MRNSSRTAKLAIFLAIIESSDAFAPSAGRVQRQSQNVVLSATRQNHSDDGWKKVAGGAAAFATGLGFMAQVAFADPASIASADRGQ